ncbi:MAG: DUF3467 domain-containing protein [bacterium]|nr:DUF3467 domain-containing protein [bacterium]
MENSREIRVDASNGTEFFAEEVSVSHSPLRFVLDFKCMTPRVDMNNQPLRMVVKHNVLMLDPHFAKELVNVLQNNIGKYEKRFGKIEKPEVLKKAAKQVKKGEPVTDTIKQDYFG